MILVQFNNQQEQMEKTVCHVCSRSDDELKVILHFIRKRLQRISNEYLPDYTDQNKAAPKHSHAFGRILEALMGKPLRNCPHDKFSRYLRRKLKCDNLTFHNLCNQLLQSIAERNYQLQVLNLQLKNIADTCLRLSQLPQAEQLRHEDELRLEQAHQTHQTPPSIPSSHNELRASDPIFVQPLLTHYSNSYGSIPVLFMINPQEVNNPLFHTSSHPN